MSLFKENDSIFLIEEKQYDTYGESKTYHDGDYRLLLTRFAFPLPNPPPNRICRFKSSSTM